MEGDDPQSHITKLVEEITTSGSKKLEDSQIKKIKQLCKSDDSVVRRCFTLVWNQLQKPHAEIRFSAFLMVDFLFQRSHLFRTLLLEEFEAFCNFTLELNPKQALPPPKAVAKMLKEEAIRAIHSWHDKFASNYKKLGLGYRFLKGCKHVDFEQFRIRHLNQRRQEEADRERQDVRRRLRLERVEEAIEEKQAEMESCLIQAKNAIELLFPIDFFNQQQQHHSETNFSFPSKTNSEQESDLNVNEEEESDNEEEEDDDDDDDDFVEVEEPPTDLHEHGVLSRNFNIDLAIELNIRENSDNSPLIEELRDCYKLINSQYIPIVKSWLDDLAKYGGDRQLIERMIQLKSNLKSCEEDCSSLGILKDAEKEKSSAEKKQTSRVFSNADVSPTHCDESNVQSTSKTRESSNPDPKQALLTKAPKLRFADDLEYWTNPEEMPLPQTQTFDSLHQYWIPKDDEKPNSNDAAAVLRQRVIPFVGRHQPVKWKCRAPLPTGKLCPRMDRIKCPFHGKIVPRDEMGNPVNEKDKEKKTTEETRSDDWQDPELLRDIQAATGMDLKVKKPRRGKKKKYPNLTDLKAYNNTTRKRLEKKVLNSQSIQRVAESLDRIDQKRHNEKFSHTFGCTFTS